jgi:hypothetical protein
MATFKNPAGDPVEREEDEIRYWDGNTDYPMIDKGNGTFLTSGFPKDASWTAGLIAKGDGKGLNTSGWWEAAPDYIQGKVNQATRESLWGAPTSSTPTRAPGPTAAEKEALKKEAWEKDKESLKGPTDWTAYWNAARRATGDGGVPAWLTALNENQRIPSFAGFGSIPKPQMPTTYEDYKPWANLELNPRSTDWMAGLDAGMREGLRVPAAHQVGLGQWTNLLPSERQGLQGLVESQGGNYSDWYQDMERSWPQWGRSPRTRFGGGF